MGLVDGVLNLKVSIKGKRCDIFIYFLRSRYIIRSLFCLLAFICYY